MPTIDSDATPNINSSGMIVQVNSSGVLPWICAGLSSSERARKRTTQ